MKVIATELVVERVKLPAGLSLWKRLTTPQGWRVCKTLTVIIESADANHGHTIIVPAGTFTDFASVPRWLKPLLPESLLYSTAAVVHDRLYKSGEVGKRIADAMLAGLLQDCDGATNFEAELFFLAVHLWGFAAWNAHRRNDGPAVNHMPD